MRSILLHVEDPSSAEVRLEAALALARASNGHLTCLHVTPVDPYVAFDGFGGMFVMGSIVEAIEKQGAAMRTMVEDRLRAEAVSWEFHQTSGSSPYTLLAHAALADVVIAGRSLVPSATSRAAVGQLADLILGSRCPVLVPGNDGVRFDPTGPVMIAWNGSREAANAVRGSLSLLRLASRIEVLRIDEEGEEGQLFPSARLVEYLERHDLRAELRTEPRRHAIADVLVDRARAVGASHIVLGGYGHSRLGEYMFGGVTRSLLAASPVNLVIAH